MTPEPIPHWMATVLAFWLGSVLTLGVLAWMISLAIHDATGKPTKRNSGERND